MYKHFKLGLVNIHIYKEKGNLWINRKPVMYSVLGYENEPICLRDYMNLKDVTLEQAVKILNDCNTVFVRNSFDICFYDEESVNKFIEVSLEG